MTREIGSGDWPAFCQRLTGQLAGAMATLEVTAHDGVRTVLAANAAFESMVFKKTNACSDLIVLRLNGTKEIVHEIVEPIHILLRASNGSGDYNPLLIEAESGEAQLTFHPVIHARMIEGLRTG